MAYLSSHRERFEDFDERHVLRGEPAGAHKAANEYSAASNGVEALDWYSDDYVVAARRQHPRIRKTLTLAEYLGERHVAVVPWSDAGSVIDAALAEEGTERDVAVQLPSLISALFIVANSDFLLTLPRRTAEQLGNVLLLALDAAPFRTPQCTVKVFFHARHASTPGHRWLRDQLPQAMPA